MTATTKEEAEELVLGKMTSMFCHAGHITNKRNQVLFTREWHPINCDSPIALVFICHGFSEHLGSYHRLGEALARKRILAFGQDLVGHGRSDGKRAYIESVDEFVDDIIFQCQMVRDQQDKNRSNLPLFIVAHSMGGMVAIRANLCYPNFFAGMVLIGPLIIPGPQMGFLDFRVTSFRAFVVRCALSPIDWISPEIVIGGIDLNLVTRDDQVKQVLKSDTLRWTSGCKVRLLLAFVSCLESNLNMLSSLKVPFLSIHGTNDSLCNVSGSRRLEDCTFVTDKTITEYPNAVHNLLMEVHEVRTEALQQIIDWILARC